MTRGVNISNVNMSTMERLKRNLNGNINIIHVSTFVSDSSLDSINTIVNDAKDAKIDIYRYDADSIEGNHNNNNDVNKSNGKYG